MNTTEHLLTCLAEEAAEIQQAVAKALRFGLDDGYPASGRTNERDIRRELNDLVAVVELLQAFGVIDKRNPSSKDLEDVLVKKARVLEYMDYARARGTLKD